MKTLYNINEPLSVCAKSTHFAGVCSLSERTVRGALDVWSGSLTVGNAILCIQCDLSRGRRKV